MADGQGFFESNPEYKARAREEESNKKLELAGYKLGEDGRPQPREQGGYEVQPGTEADLMQKQTQQQIMQQDAQLQLMKNQSIGSTLHNITNDYIETGDVNTLQDGILENPAFAEKLQSMNITSVAPINWGDGNDLALVRDEMGTDNFNKMIQTFEGGIIPEDVRTELNKALFLTRDSNGKATVADITDLDGMLNKNTRRGRLLSDKLNSINKVITENMTQRLTPTAAMQNAQYIAGLKQAQSAVPKDSEAYKQLQTQINSMEATQMTSKEKNYRTDTRVSQAANPFMEAIDSGDYSNISPQELTQQINREQGVDKSLFTSSTGDWATQGKVLSTLKDGIELNNNYIQKLKPDEWKKTYDDVGKYLNVLGKYTKTDDNGNAYIDEKDLKNLLTETTVNTRIGKYFAKYLKDTSGTAVADAEFARLMKVVTGGEGANLDIFKKAFNEFVSASKDSLVNEVKATSIGKEANTIKRLQEIDNLNLDYSEPSTKTEIKSSVSKPKGFPKFKDDKTEEQGVFDKTIQWTKDTFNSLWN